MTRTGVEHELLTVDKARAMTDQRRLARRTFPGEPGQVGEARRWLSLLIGGFEAADEAVLACSELAANAIVHTDSGLPGGMFTVRVAIEPDSVRIEVLDQGGSWTDRRDDTDRIQRTALPPEDETQCGRGLTIIAAIASAWGISGDQQARTAWCEVKSR